MTDPATPTSYRLGSASVRRIGYGAMQLAGPGAFGPPADRKAAVALLREAIALGVDHIDTSDVYGPHVTNQILREALHPYRDGLVIATKVGAVRGPAGEWVPAMSAAEIDRAVHDNLRNLGVDVLDVVNLRAMFDAMRPTAGSIEAPLTALLELQRRGLVRHLGLSNVTSTQVDEGRRLADIVCVQNHYNLAHRSDDALIDSLAAAGIPYVPFFPLGGFAPLQSAALHDVSRRVGATPMQVAIAWLLRRSPNVLVIPGTGSIDHLRENSASDTVSLTADDLATLDAAPRG